MKMIMANVVLSHSTQLNIKRRKQLCASLKYLSLHSSDGHLFLPVDEKGTPIFSLKRRGAFGEKGGVHAGAGAAAAWRAGGGDARACARAIFDRHLSFFLDPSIHPEINQCLFTLPRFAAAWRRGGDR